jgi:response regulator of citrate/malate metabolism
LSFRHQKGEHPYKDQLIIFYLLVIPSHMWDEPLQSFSQYQKQYSPHEKISQAEINKVIKRKIKDLSILDLNRLDLSGLNLSGIDVSKVFLSYANLNKTIYDIERDIS